MYYIGRIKKTHGLKGELKVLNESDFDRFVEGKIVYTENNIELKIKSVRKQNEILLVTFLNYDTIEKSSNLQGLELFTNEKPQLDEGEYLMEDIIGLKCYTDEMVYIGEVIDLNFLPSQVILEIKGDIKNKILIPFIDEFIVSVDNEKIIIKPIEGLL